MLASSGPANSASLGEVERGGDGFGRQRAGDGIDKLRVRFGNDLFGRQSPGDQALAIEMAVALHAIEVAPDFVGQGLNFERRPWDSRLAGWGTGWAWAR